MQNMALEIKLLISSSVVSVLQNKILLFAGFLPVKLLYIKLISYSSRQDAKK